MPILIHGDAAVAAQGCYDGANGAARWIQNRGTIHIVVNNQIGFPPISMVVQYLLHRCCENHVNDFTRQRG